MMVADPCEHKRQVCGEEKRATRYPNAIKKTVTNLLLAAVLIFPTILVANSARAEPNWADESDAALECSASFFVLSALGHKYDGIDGHFSKFGEVSQLLAKMYDSDERFKNRLDLMKSKASEITKLGETFDKHAPKVQLIIDSCMGWYVQLIKYGLDHGDTQQSLDKVMQKLYKAAPRPSTVYDYPYDDKELFHPMIIEAFEIWTKNGRVTTMTVREELMK